MKKVLKFLAWGLAGLVVLALVAYAWAYHVAMGRYETEWTVHRVEFPMPFPLTADELAALGADRVAAGASAKDPLTGVDLRAIARERATRRGQHLVDSRVGCTNCHGKDFSGKAVVDSPFVGRYIAPNLTEGEGSVTRGFTASDWDRAVRHGVRHNGQTSAMPAIEFVNLSDHELSDIVAYVRSLPPVNRTLDPVKVGPVFAFMLATDPKALATFSIDHQKPHAVEPPIQAPSVELGQHLTQVCRGCHGNTLSGGKLAGDPAMPEVANLTPHETGLQGWTEADFLRALREGKRKDGTPIADQMPWRAYGQMNDTELEAIWAYLQTVPAVPKGNH